MAHILHLASTSRLPAIQADLARIRAQQVALVFPLHTHPLIAEHDTLLALRAFCEALDKDVAIIGGDDALRALAVAVGFVAATSLDAYAAREHSGYTPPPGSLAAWIEADAAFVASQHMAAEHQPSSDEPPAYVLELLRAEGTYTGPRDDPTQSSPVRRSRAVTRPLSRYASADDSIAAAIRASFGGWMPPSGADPTDSGPL